MSRYTLVLFLAYLTIGGCSKSKPDAESIQGTFISYKAAVLESDGSTSARLVTKSTLDEYQKYVDWALRGDSETLKGLSTINKIQVLMMKHRIPRMEWDSMTGEKAFIYAIDQGWVGKDEIAVTAIDNIQVSGLKATSDVLINNNKAPTRFHFTKEGGSWKFDMIRTLQFANVVFKAQIKQAGIEEDEFIFLVLESISGKKVSETIWEPLGI